MLEFWEHARAIDTRARRRKMGVERWVQCVCIGRFPLEEGTVAIDLEQIAINGRSPDLVSTRKGCAIFYHKPSTNGEAAIPNRAIGIPEGAKTATYSGYRKRVVGHSYEQVEWKFD